MGLSSPMASANDRIQRFSTAMVKGAYSLPTMFSKLLLCTARCGSSTLPAIRVTDKSRALTFVQSNRPAQCLLRFDELCLHGRCRSLGIAGSERGDHAPHAADHDCAHAPIVQCQDAQVLHVVAVELDRAHQTLIGNQCDPRSAECRIGCH